MKVFSMFSGIGGFEQAFSNHEIVGACEIDKYARSIFRKQYPNVKIFHDARKIKPNEIGIFDILVAGFPCQSFSLAGKRRGFEDTRGTLFFEISRIAQARKPQYLILENVKGLLSHDKGRTIRTIFKTLADLGYNTESNIIDTANFLPQHRERIFFVATLGKKRTSEIFHFQNRESVPSPTSEKRSKMQICTTLTAGYSKEGSDHTHVNTSSNSAEYRVYDTDGHACTLKANGGGAGAKTGLYSVVLTPDRLKKSQNGRRFKSPGEPAINFTTQDRHGVSNGTDIRRLTPVECERLQGFPDNYTKTGIDDNGNKVEISDSQRYKCLGNAVSVPAVKCVLDRMSL